GDQATAYCRPGPLPRPREPGQPHVRVSESETSTSRKDDNMTSTKEQTRKAIFGKLRSLRRKLNRQGVPCDYARSVLSHESGVGGFKITCDASLLTRISVQNGEAIEEYDASNFEQGLARVRELFHA